MRKKTLWLVLSSLMALSLVIASCSPATAPATPPTPATPATQETPTTPSSSPATPAVPSEKEAVKPTGEAPKYGGELKVAITADITAWDPFASSVFYGGLATALTNQGLWAGDWAKGPAGGYGTSETDWAITGYDVFDQKTGNVAESWKWTLDTAKDQGTIVYQIRKGIRYSLDPNNEASRLAGGRELTADDVLFTLKALISDPVALLYVREPSLRSANITKTGPWEISITVPFETTELAIRRFGHISPIFPKEVLEKYGRSNDWKKLVGTGPFMVTEYVPGSVLTFTKNKNFWMKDPVGPGKGNQLPYIDSYRQFIIPDASTRQAALRTSKVDTMTLGWEDAIQMKKTSPALLEMERPGLEAFAIKPRVDQPPFNDVRVRRAMMMATDFEAINKSLHDGRAQILNYPIAYYKSYADVYLGLDDPVMPASVKELYTYNPEKARTLLKEAGYPGGFKTSALMTSTEVDTYSIIKDMWAKIGIDLDFEIKDTGAMNAIIRSGQVKGMTRSGSTPIAGWSGGTDWVYSTGSTVNPGNINDPVINEAMVKVKRNLITNPVEAKRQYKDLLKYVLDQAYAIPVSGNPQSVFWWPWLKNYTGEVAVGYLAQPNWIQWVWIDRDLKKTMGY